MCHSGPFPFAPRYLVPRGHTVRSLPRIHPGGCHEPHTYPVVGWLIWWARLRFVLAGLPRPVVTTLPHTLGPGLRFFPVPLSSLRLLRFAVVAVVPNVEFGLCRYDLVVGYVVTLDYFVCYCSCSYGEGTLVVHLCRCYRLFIRTFVVVTFGFRTCPIYSRIAGVVTLPLRSRCRMILPHVPVTLILVSALSSLYALDSTLAHMI